MNGNDIDPQQVGQLITNWSSPDEQIRRPAEQAIEQYLLPSNGKLDLFIKSLCQLLSNPDQTTPDVRTRIAILIRKRIAMKMDKNKKSLFLSLHSNTRQNVLRILLSQVCRDPDKLTRNQIADCLTELSTRTFSDISNEYQSVQFFQRIYELYTLSKDEANSNGNNTGNDSASLNVWDEKTSSLNVSNRINALQILGHLCQWCSDDNIVKQNQQSISQLYRVAFKEDTNRKVNIAALEAIQLTMTPLKPNEVIGFIPLMFDILKLLESTLNLEGQKVAAEVQKQKDYEVDDDDYEQTQYLLEIIVQIASSQTTLFHDHMKQISPLLPFITAFTQLAATATLPDKVRSLSLEFMLCLAENDPSFVRKKSIVSKSIINICLDHFLLSQIDDTEWMQLSYGDDDNLNSISSTGEYALDRLLNALTPKAIIPAIYKKLGLVPNAEGQQKGDLKYWKNADWKRRHCAMTVITQISDHMTNGSGEVVLATSKCLDSLHHEKSERVLYASINAIGQLSNDHFDVLPSRFSDGILKGLHSVLAPNHHAKVQCHGCAALINFVPSCEQSHIEPILSQLIDGVMSVLQNANRQWQQCGKGNNDGNNGNNNNGGDQSELKKSWQCTQEQALTAIAALAEKAGDLFSGYYDTFAPVLMGIIQNAESEDMREIRCRAIECMACFGEAVGGNKFGQHAVALMKGTIGFFENHGDMKEIADDAFIKTNLCCWPRVLASIGGEAFGPYLNRVVEILEAVAKINIISNKVSQEDLDTDDFDPESLDPQIDVIETANGVIAIDSQKMENKMAALAVFDSLCEHYQGAMVSFIERMLPILLECIDCKYSLDLRSDSCKMAPRYIEVVLDAMKKEKATRQQLVAVTQVLLMKMMAILDEGRDPNTNNNGGGGGDGEEDSDYIPDSATIGTATVTVLEMIQSVEKTDADDYKAESSVIRTFIDVPKLKSLIESMFESVVRSQERIEMFAYRDEDGTYDAIAREELEEEKEFEDDLLFNIALILAEFIKIYKDDFARCLMTTEPMRLKLVQFLNPSHRAIRNPQFVHKTGVYIVCDLYENCSLQVLNEMLSLFVPLLFNIAEHDEDPAVQQATFYCLGLMVSKCKNAMMPHCGRILRLCTECITKNSINYRKSPLYVSDGSNLKDADEATEHNERRQFLGVIDNAMATICKVIQHIDWSMTSNQNEEKMRDEAMAVWFNHLPLKCDTVEGKLCHQFLQQMVQKKHPIVIGHNLSNLPFILKVFAAIRNTDMSSSPLDQFVAEFAETICKNQPQFAQQLSSTERKKLNIN